MRRRKAIARAGGVVDQARMMLGSFETLAEKNPDIVDKWAATISDFGTVADGWAFAVRTTSPTEPLVPYVMVVTPVGLMLCDTASGRVVRGLSWPYFCDFEARRPTDVQHIRFAWYNGEGTKIEQRLEDPRPIRRDECEGWILLSDAGEPLIQDILAYIDTAGVPADRVDLSAP